MASIVGLRVARYPSPQPCVVKGFGKHTPESVQCVGVYSDVRSKCIMDRLRHNQWDVNDVNKVEDVVLVKL